MLLQGWFKLAATSNSPEAKPGLNLEPQQTKGPGFTKSKGRIRPQSELKQTKGPGFTQSKGKNQASNRVEANHGSRLHTVQRQKSGLKHS